jgi:hypothetical protein
LSYDLEQAGVLSLAGNGGGGEDGGDNGGDGDGCQADYVSSDRPLGKLIGRGSFRRLCSGVPGIIDVRLAGSPGDGSTPKDGYGSYRFCGCLH